MKTLLARLAARARRQPSSAFQLRLALPRLEQAGPDAVAAFATRASDRHPWQEGGQATLRELALRHPQARVEACLHPASCSLMRVAMPPLPEQRRRIAVLGELEPLVLGDVDALAVAYGPREADGGVTVAWLRQDDLTRALAQWRAIGLQIAALYPAPFFLRVPQEGEAVSRMREGWRLTRTGRDSGTVEFALAAEQPVGPYGRSMPEGAAPAADDWSGPGPSWALPREAGEALGGAGRHGLWAAAGVAVALVVWIGGLNLQAQRLAGHGQALQAQMRARVQAAFPELPVIVDPLQQARQQRDARRAGGGQADDGAAPDFGRLVRASAAHLDGLDGQVQALGYRDGRLSITLRGGTPPSAADAAALAERVGEIGLSVEAAPDGWVMLGAAPANAPGGQAATRSGAGR